MIKRVRTVNSRGRKETYTDASLLLLLLLSLFLGRHMCVVYVGRMQVYIFFLLSRWRIEGV